MDIMTALSTVSVAIKTVKDIRDIDSSFDKAELKAKLASVISDLSDIKLALVAATEEIGQQNKEIERLREAFRYRDELVEYNGYKYRKFEDGKPRGKPFCPVCEQKYGIFFQLTVAINGQDECPSCRARYKVTNFIWDRST